MAIEIKMGAFLCRCCWCDEEFGASVSPTNESLLLTRTARAGGSPEEASERTATSSISFPASKSSLINFPKILPASAEEEREFMVRSYSSGTLQEIIPECLLCMENFTDTRPTTLSLCACGINRNTFHLECLLEWRRKSNKTNCPICDKELFFEVTETHEREE